VTSELLRLLLFYIVKYLSDRTFSDTLFSMPKLISRQAIAVHFIIYYNFPLEQFKHGTQIC